MTLLLRLRPYSVVFGARYRVILQYRAAALAGAVTQFFWGFIRVMVFYAFYESTSHDSTMVRPPMEMADVVTYVWLGQALLGLQPWNHDLELEKKIRDGGVAYELLRPVDLYAYWYVRTIARRTATASLRALPIVAVAGVGIPLVGVDGWALAGPASATALLGFVVTIACGVLLGAAITTLVHVSLLWTISGDGMTRMMPALVIVFSGMVVPLPLFPDFLQPFLEALPFRFLADVPYRVYSGDLAGAVVGELALQALLWTAALVVVGRFAMSRGRRRVVVQGG